MSSRATTRAAAASAVASALASDASSVASGMSSHTHTSAHTQASARTHSSGASRSTGRSTRSESAAPSPLPLPSNADAALPPADGAPILVISKLFETRVESVSVGVSAHTSVDATAKPSVAAQGDAVVVTTRSGALVRTESVECDSVYAPGAALTDLYVDAITPIVAAVMEGVNALLFVTGNDPLCRRLLFDNLTGANHPAAAALAGRAPSPCDLGAVGFAADTIMNSIEAKRASMNAENADVYNAEVHVSYCAVDDAGLYDMFERRIMESPVHADPNPELEVVEDDYESVYVRGLTTFGPVPDLSVLLELLRAGSATASTMCESAWASGSAFGIVASSPVGGPQISSDPEVRARSPMRRRLSTVIRLTISQVIRAPGAPMNALKSHLYIVDAAGMETLAPSYSSSAPSTGLPTSATDVLEPCMNARGIKAIAELMAYFRARPAAPFSLGTSAQFGLRGRIKAEQAAQYAQSRRSRSRQGRAGSSSDAVASLEEGFGKDRAVESAVLSLNPALARDPAVSPYAVSLLTQVLAECLGGNCLTVVLCALATTGTPPDVSLAVLEVAATLRRGQCYPIVASTSARGLLRHYRRTTRQLRASMHKVQDDVSKLKTQLEDARTIIAGLPSDASGSRSSSASAGSRTRRSGPSVEPPALPGPPRRRTEPGHGRHDYDTDEEDRSRLAPVPEDAAVWAELSEEYESRIAELSEQLMEAEEENALLRDAVGEDRTTLVERLEDAENEAIEAEARRQVLANKYEKIQEDMDDLMTELSTLQANVRSKGKDLRAAREHAAVLEQKLEAANRKLDIGSRGDGSGARGVDRSQLDEAFRRRAALVQQCLALRHRIAALTTDGDEYRRMARADASEDDILREMPGDSSYALPAEVIVSPASGQPLSYSALTMQHNAQRKQAARMRAVLEDAATHIRGLREKLTRARAQAAAAVAAAAADVDGMIQSPTAFKAGAARDGESDKEIHRLREQVTVLRSHLVRARDALVAAKQRSSMSRAGQRRPSDDGADAMAAGTGSSSTLRSQLAAVHDRASDLERENERLRHALEAATKGVTVHADSSTVLGELQSAEKRCVELLSENAVLAGQVDAYKAQIKQITSKYERIISKLRGAPRRGSVDPDAHAPASPPGLRGSPTPDGSSFASGSWSLPAAPPAHGQSNSRKHSTESIPGGPFPPGAGSSTLRAAGKMAV